MGPALRLTPLSPACGPCRSRKLYARRFNAASTGSCEPGRPAASHRPALAPAPVPSEAEPGPKTGPRRPAVPRPVFLPGASSGPVWPEGLAQPRHRAGNPACPTLRLRGVSGSGSGLPGDCSPRVASSRSSTARHLAVASIRFQNPFSVAGLSAFVSEGPIPVSMSGGCAARAIRARTRACTYPLSATMPVDKGG
jgi:hypothetical protein